MKRDFIIEGTRQKEIKRVGHAKRRMVNPKFTILNHLIFIKK